MADSQTTVLSVVFVSLFLFIVAITLTIAAGVDIRLALIWNTLAALDVAFSINQIYSNAANPLVFVANILDAFVFALLAVAIATVFFRFINNIDIERRGALSRIKRLRKHVIIAPYNSFASALMKEFNTASIPYVVITDSEPEARKLYEKKTPVLIGIIASSDAFKTAGIDRARLVVACDEDDTQNALICVTAKSANPRMRILSRVSRLDSIPKLGKAGAYRMILPEVATGTKLGEEISKAMINAEIGKRKEQP